MTATAPLEPVPWYRTLFLRRRRRREQADTADFFRSAPWPLYGLPPSVPCRRFLGGWGQSGHRSASKLRITALELAHLPLEGPLEQQLRVEVTPVDEPRHDLDNLARGLWERAQLELNDARASDDFVRLVQEIKERYQTDANISWQEVPIVIDGTPLTGIHAAIDDDWVTVVEVGDTSVCISGAGWSEIHPALVTITDFEPYIRGSEELWG